MSFANKVILITGASSGIGADTARHLAKLGGKVALVGRDQTRLNVVIEQIKIAGSPTPFGIVADVTKDAKRIIDDTIKHFGQLDVLINNAGIANKDTVVDFETNEFDRVLDTNLRSVLILSSLAIPYLSKTKGNIVNVSSVAGIRSRPNVMSYSVSKAALNQFTRCSAIDLGVLGIRVNAINPGVIRTSIVENSGVNKANAEKYYDEVGKRYPIGRAGMVEDTSAAIAYLASDSASFLTGVLLSVDGGSIVFGGIGN